MKSSAPTENQNPARTIPNPPSWSEAEFPSIKSSFALCQRINFILERLSEEPWLPPTLKNSITTVCTRVLTAHIEGIINGEMARLLVEQLAASTYQYEDLTLSSKTLCQIRTLDLELNDRLSYQRSLRRA